MSEYEDEPLEDRIAELRVYMGHSKLNGYFRELAEYFGKDAVMGVILRELELDNREDVEKLAEIAFDLVPGQIEKIHKTQLRHISYTVVSPGDAFSAEVEALTKHIKIGEWRARVMFEYDKDLKALFVYYGKGNQE